MERIAKYAQTLAPYQDSARVAAFSSVMARARQLHSGAGLFDVINLDSPDSFAPSTVASRPEGELMRHLCEVGDFVRRLRIQARFGELSRARLCLLRVQMSGEYAECDWIARPPDPWDAALPPIVGRRNASTQALHDAIKIRALLFRALPDLQKAELRGYRYSPDDSLDLILSGTVSREVRVPASVCSLVMRAKLFGFRFWLEEGILENLQPEQPKGADSPGVGSLYQLRREA